MSTRFTRPAGAYDSTSVTTNKDKYQDDDVADTAIDAPKVDGDLNQIIDNLNALDDDINAVISTGVSDGDKGDITISSSGTVWSIGNDAVGTSEIAADAVTLTEMAGGTDGNLISYDTSGDPVAVATGTVDQVLTSNGAGAAPTFQTLSTVVELISTTTISSPAATATVTAGFSTSYSVIFFVIEDLVSATAGDQLFLTVSSDAGSSYKSSNYAYVVQILNSSSSTYSASVSASASAFLISQGTNNVEGEGHDGVVNFFRPSVAEVTRLEYTLVGQQATSGDMISYKGSCIHKDKVAINAIKLYFGSGNITSGVIRMYGIKNS